MARIPDLPAGERPRERMARLGAGALSDAELLAIFLRTGVVGSSAIEVGQRLLKKYGSLTELGGLSVKELSCRAWAWSSQSVSNDCGVRIRCSLCGGEDEPSCDE